jgi:uncharacterized protein (DUF1684 family)
MSGCQAAEVPETVDPLAHAREIDQWHASREEGLQSTDGWMGSDSSNDIVFPEGKAPDFMGSFFRNANEVLVRINPGVDVFHEGETEVQMALTDDLDEDTTELVHGTLIWHIIEREAGSPAVRLHDSESPEIAIFEGIDEYPTDLAWRLAARLEPYDPRAWSRSRPFTTPCVTNPPRVLLFSN